MNYRNLGTTGLKVSRLCFGSLTISPLQSNLPLRQGSAVIQAALDAGVNFIDTAELYHNYAYIAQAITGRKHQVVIASKSYAYTYQGMQDSVIRACREIGRDYIDIFMLHEQTSRLTLKGHGEALRFLVEAKQRGMIRAVGVSTHAVEVVRAAALREEIDVIHCIYNQAGLGIIDGHREDMLAAIKLAKSCGKGIYTMKALGGGHLSLRAHEALRWAWAEPLIDAVAVGMKTAAEVAMNVAICDGRAVPEVVRQAVHAAPRRLLIEEWCQGCGRCVAHCPMGALRLEKGRAVVDYAKCVTCGYCGAYCPEFCLKII